MIAGEIIRWVAGSLAFLTLAILLYGVWQGTRRRAGRMIGRGARWLAVPWSYLTLTALFAGFGYVGWKPLPLQPPPIALPWIALLGSLFYFPGTLLVIWGRIALGRNYSVSSALAARLFEDHQLIVSGPFAIVRHPMYLGVMLAAAGGLLIYFTWTTLALVALSAMLLLRARVEERILELEFGELWQSYCRRVPKFIPRLSSARRPIATEREIDDGWDTPVKQTTRAGSPRTERQ